MDKDSKMEVTQSLRTLLEACRDADAEGPNRFGLHGSASTSTPCEGHAHAGLYGKVEAVLEALDPDSVSYWSHNGSWPHNPNLGL